MKKNNNVEENSNVKENKNLNGKKKLFNINHIIRLILLLSLGIIYYIVKKYTGYGLICVSHEVFGITCCGCGITRMIFSLIKLDIYQAFRYNMFIFIIFPYFVYIACRSSWQYIRGKNFEECYVTHICIRYYRVIFVLIVLWTVIRNFIPFLQPVVV